MISLMPHHPRIGEEGLIAFENMKIRAAQAHAADADQRLVRTGLRGCSVLQGQLHGRFADDRFHASCPPVSVTRLFTCESNCRKSKSAPVAEWPLRHPPNIKITFTSDKNMMHYR
jgi:hypothetical protein